VAHKGCSTHEPEKVAELKARMKEMADEVGMKVSGAKSPKK